ncbi:MAG TPA: glycosyltransferase family 2 protein [Planctomycetes bacterium]|nr:glycosyltransferase family 2 protein [Planctomycetota bacterium]
MNSSDPGPRREPDVLLIIPCLNEEEGLARVLETLPIQEQGLRVVVVDNGSTDRSAEVARGMGVQVVREERRGYGAACLRGIAQRRNERIIAFLDADFSDDPREIGDILGPLRRGEAEFVLGSRMLLPASRKALLPQARYGNRLAAFLLRLLFGHRCTDLGPFRALSWEALQRMGMKDQNFGWTVEMQAKAGLLGLRCLEVPVSYKQRIGASKITGTLSGTLAASYKILWTLFWLRLRPSLPPVPLEEGAKVGR